MPLTAKGKEIKAAMTEEYGEEKGERVFYASKNAGRISGVDSAGRQKFTAAFRDARRKGLSLDKALAVSLRTTRDAEGGEGNIEGAHEVFKSLFELHHKIGEHLEGHEGHGEHGGGHAAGHAGAPTHNVHGAGAKPPPAHAVKAPHVAASVSPHAPAVPKATVPAATTPKAPAAPPAPKAATTPATPKTAPATPAATASKPMTTSGTKPSGTKDAEPKFYKDAARRFRKTFRDAVRENMPLPKLIELGVISGTESNGKTPDSEGKEYKGPTKDAFRTAMRDAIAKGTPTRDALRTALQGHK